MIASKSGLKTVGFYAETELSSVNTAFNVEKLTLNELEELIDSGDLEKIITPNETDDFFGRDFIHIEGEGYIVFANSPAQMWEMVHESKLTFEDLPKGRVANRIFIVTGAGQGFGAGVAEVLFAEGGNIVIADINEEKGNEMVKTLNAKNQNNRAIFIKANVADPKSVEALVNQTVLAFGGLDVMVSNAGIWRAGGLDEMTPETFKSMTEVNYNGFFYCSKYASKVMKIQTQHKKDFYCDIIQVNSKSGLKGSKNNFAYAGGKFGGIGLVQSFALELMENNIKVNAISPGNFFDGPLWSDPENGLFVQYLNAGKVPGAKNLDDVKKFYENQVPAQRGCRVIDVARAIFYAIEQEYETGQAIPVTGGQIMLK